MEGVNAMANDHTSQRPRTQSAIIRFHGYEISSWRDERDGESYASIPSMCRPLGLDPQTQIARLKGNPLFSPYVRQGKDIPTLSGAPRSRPQDTHGLNIKKVEMWLASINAKFIKNPEVRNRLLMFQRECAEVLHGYWEGLPQQRHDIPQSGSSQIEEATKILEGFLKIGQLLHAGDIRTARAA
jgi:hypothetical protein